MRASHMTPGNERSERIRARSARAAAAGFCVLLVVAACVGCGGGGAARGHFALVIGSRGHTSGSFNRPRGIGFDAARGMLYVVDWDGRIQKFTAAGEFRASWIMPEVAKGKPEGLCVRTNGNVLVADTHYSSVVEFAPDGRLLGRFGSYGTGPGQFIYPVGVCCDAADNIYVSEYGENDRVQKFDPSGKFVRSWGGFGTAPGQFQRPGGICMSTNGMLFVADAANHRVQVFSADGDLLRVLGREGAGPGELRYPYDVAVLGEVLYVLEYGNQRIQKLALDGKPLGSFGKPGKGDGCLALPWRMTAAGGAALYVSDTDNCRVVKVDF